MTVASQSPDWSAGQYARFADHRLQPAIDLINRIPDGAYTGIVDLGCGNGKVTPLLKERWPAATVTGIDSSGDMLAAARDTGADVAWRMGDIASWRPGGEDLVFSNAAFHWLDDHEALIGRLLGGLPTSGVLAFQMPDNFDQPSHAIMRDVATDPAWQGRLQGVASRQFVAPAADYVHWLEKGAERVEVWQTTYHQVLEGANPVFEWLKGAGMRPYLARLDIAEAETFQARCRERLADAYPGRSDGTTLFPFRRLFAVALR